ncbi:MAG: CpsD/CapB family tyrosine-protein kinase [Clostridium sp.]
MILMQERANSHYGEEYRRIRENIRYYAVDQELKTILVTSCNQSEGKSTIASNLAYAFSENESKTLIIDCDLRKPSMHRKFKLSNTIGLTELLLGEKTAEEVTHKIKENLDIITTGELPPSPSEVVNSEKLEEILEKLKEKYQKIIIDSPPALVISDAQSLSHKVDGTILVFKNGATKKEDAAQVKGLIEGVGGRIIGAVLNGKNNKNSKYYTYYQE